jgi:predicted nucleic acid-binding protein
MNLIIDANIVFAALIKDNVTRLLLVNEDIRLYAPEFIFSEIEKYSDEICEKSGKTPEDLKKVLNVLTQRITVVPDKELNPYLDYAERISPDPKDVPYIAACLRMKCALWTNDKPLKKSSIRVYTTEELLSEI